MIETNGRRYRVVHIETKCWGEATSIRDARRTSWLWHRSDKPWRTVEANASIERPMKPQEGRLT
jgi:hypothetical protein